jgi:hypothetical protein
VSRYLEGGLKSRKRGPRRTPVEELVIGYRKRFKTIGQERICFSRTTTSAYPRGR